MTIANDLKDIAESSFAGKTTTDAWRLRGEYISLAKKVYLLDDAISSGRWEAYARLWGGA
jgi:hypothetical protein